MSERFYGMDFLRMALMLSGIVFHAGLFYTCTEHETLWPIQVSECHMTFDVICGWLHLFRIPAFFVIAGFFAALLLEKRGLTGFVINRFWRIVLPFVLAWLILFPVVILIFYLLNHLGDEHVFSDTITGLFSRELIGYKPKITIHLWFLYYLIFFYVVLLLIRRFWKPRSKRPLLLVLGFAMVLSGLGFFFCESGEFNGFYSFNPDFFSLGGFAPFFFFGYLLYHHQYWIKRFMKSYVSMLAWSIIPFITYLLLRIGRIDLGETISKLLLVISSIIFSWLMILALIGWVSYKFRQSNPVIRYLSDASYWIYLVHLPMILLIGGLLNELIHFSLFVWILNILLTSIFTLLTYHFLVRPTIIGKLLNGRKYPFANPFRITRKIEGQMKM